MDEQPRACTGMDVLCLHLLFKKNGMTEPRLKTLQMSRCWIGIDYILGGWDSRGNNPPSLCRFFRPTLPIDIEPRS